MNQLGFGEGFTERRGGFLLKRYIGIVVESRRQAPNKVSARTLLVQMAQKIGCKMAEAKREIEGIYCERKMRGRPILRNVHVSRTLASGRH